MVREAPTDTEHEASGCEMAWKVAIGRLNWALSLAYWLAMSTRCRAAPAR